MKDQILGGQRFVDRLGDGKYHPGCDFDPDFLDRQGRRGHELPGNLEAGIPSPDIIGESGNGDRQHPHDNGKRHPLVTDRCAPREKITGRDCRHKTKEHGHPSHVGHGFGVLFSLEVRSIDGIDTKRELSHKGGYDQGNNKRNDEDISVAGKKTGHAGDD